MSDEEYMSLALKEAEIALENKEVPVGAIVVLNGEVVGKGHNKKEEKLDVSSHAEIEALRNASENLGTYNLSGCTLYVTVEPCLMCSGAIMQSYITRVVYGTDDITMGAVCSHFYAFEDPSFPHRPLLTKGIKKEECEALMKKFFKTLRK